MFRFHYFSSFIQTVRRAVIQKITVVHCSFAHPLKSLENFYLILLSNKLDFSMRPLLGEVRTVRKIGWRGARVMALRSRSIRRPVFTA